MSLHGLKIKMSEKATNVQRKTLKDVQKALSYCSRQLSFVPWKQNTKKGGVAQDFLYRLCI